jgi:hypothetical protein
MFLTILARHVHWISHEEDFLLAGVALTLFARISLINSVEEAGV